MQEIVNGTCAAVVAEAGTATWRLSDAVFLLAKLCAANVVLPPILFLVVLPLCYIVMGAMLALFDPLLKPIRDMRQEAHPTERGMAWCFDTFLTNKNDAIGGAMVINAGIGLGVTGVGYALAYLGW